MKARNLGKDDLLLRGFSGHEGISRLFNFDLTMYSTKTDIDFTQVVGHPATVTIEFPGQPKRFINGIFSSFSQGRQLVLTVDKKTIRFVEYQATLTPSLWFLTRRSDCRIFQNVDVVQIIKAVFKKYAPELRPNFSSRLEQTDTDRLPKPEVREYCVQYRETDFNFISRLLEEEGIFYFFEHSETQHTFVIANSPSKIKPGTMNQKVNFIENPALNVITEWTLGQEVRPGEYTLRDFNFEHPTFDLTGHSDGQDPRKLEIYDFPGEYKKSDRGNKVAAMRMQEEEAPTLIVNGASQCPGFEAGRRFNLAGHFRKDFNLDFSLTSVFHSCDQGDNFVAGQKGAAKSFAYTNRFQCIPHSTLFRPPRVTPEPVMRGTQTAIVVGPKKEEIFTDKFGRVKVRFHWDRETKRVVDDNEQDIKDEERSCFIRVSQVWAGTNWGFMHIPRIGQEVIVDFLEGDPDQPIIVGRVYNADRMPPFDLPANQTQSGVKSRSTKEGKSSNFNEIRFEDKKDHEDLLIHAERTMHNSVEASQFITVGGDRHIKTGYTDDDGNNHGDVKELVHNNHNLHILGDQRTKIEGASHLHVQQDADATYDQGLVVSVGQKCVILADTIQLQGTTKIVLKAGASSIVIDVSGVTVLGTPFINLNSPGAPPAPEIIPLVVDPDDP